MNYYLIDWEYNITSELNIVYDSDCDDRFFTLSIKLEKNITDYSRMKGQINSEREKRLDKYLHSSCLFSFKWLPWSIAGTLKLASRSA